ncbi:PREDICTED: two-component response regulator-like APRR1 [Tarenaya hassleriana]|uniref:two-component response regulator-like APRR1 n=1 Tax=Tarenaya hassleriana TaxID=28532 RepID=UPI00053C9E2B|nr:PREDICTED: two-component response regulator-like APRR1 [Tarenaya hassleriana]
MELNSECKGGDGFIDRSKVRILLCDSDSKNLREVFTLLTECSYQVTPVRSARQVIDALNAEGPDIDIILAEVDLPMAKGMKMLKYITRDKDLRRIPVIMMSRQDEVSVVVKCLKLGAADYLVKPLRTNELLNLWTHMWRRRRMLGLAEKNMLSYDFDLVGSDPSDANTNSTNLFSDDTDDKSLRCTNLQTGTSNNPENECSVTAIFSSVHVGDGCGAADGAATSPPAVAAMEPEPAHLAGSYPYEAANKDSNEGRFSSGPKKSKLKIGESSAFFTYVKSTVSKANCQDLPRVNENGSHHSGVEAGKTNQTYRRSGRSFPYSMERSCTPPMSMEFHNRSYHEGNMNTSLIPVNSGKESSQAGVSGFSGQTAYPYYMHGAMNHAMMQSTAHHHTHASSGMMMSQYGHHFQHCPPNHPNEMGGFPYYHHPMSVSLQHGQMPMVHQPWPPASSNEVKLSKVDRREEALIKFRQKRNQRCFDKKIRYVNRKRLAERRPRVRGQFVRKVNGVNVDLNGQPDSAEYEDDDGDDDDDDDDEEDHVDDALGS